MNLADAIRNAAHPGESPLTFTEPPRPAPVETVAVVAAKPKETLKDYPKEAPKARPAQETSMTESHSPQANANGNVVRLEMFLTAEQIALLFKSIVTGQHSVMTLREAAAHLRMPAHSIETMAQEGEIPAFQFDGRWRFSRIAVDEWLASRSQDRKEQEAA